MIHTRSTQANTKLYMQQDKYQMSFHFWTQGRLATSHGFTMSLTILDGENARIVMYCVVLTEIQTNILPVQTCQPQ